MTMRVGGWLAAVFGWSWGTCAIFAALGWGTAGASAVALGVLFFSGPLVASLVWKAWIVREPVAGLDLSARFGPWLLVAWLAPLGITWASVLVAHLAGWATLDLAGVGIVERVAAARGAVDAAAVRAGLDADVLPYPVRVTLSALGYAVLPYTPLALMEEIGWRGVLQRELERLGFWRASLAGALLWGIWHAPLLWFGQYFSGDPALGAVVLVATSVPLGVLLCWIRVRAATIWAPAVAHGMFTAMAGFHELALRGGTPIFTSVAGVAGGIVLCAVLAAVFTGARAGPASPPDGAP